MSDEIFDFSYYFNLEEAVKQRVRIDPAERRQRKKEYRKNKIELKRKAKIKRKKPAFKKQQKKAKRMAKQGKTSTGKRQSTITNK